MHGRRNRVVKSVGTPTPYRQNSKRHRRGESHRYERIFEEEVSKLRYQIRVSEVELIKLLGLTCLECGKAETFPHGGHMLDLLVEEVGAVQLQCDRDHPELSRGCEVLLGDVKNESVRWWFWYRRRNHGWPVFAVAGEQEHEVYVKVEGAEAKVKPEDRFDEVRRNRCGCEERRSFAGKVERLGKRVDSMVLALEEAKADRMRNHQFWQVISL